MILKPELKPVKFLKFQTNILRFLLLKIYVLLRIEVRGFYRNLNYLDMNLNVWQVLAQYPVLLK